MIKTLKINYSLYIYSYIMKKIQQKRDNIFKHKHNNIMNYSETQSCEYKIKNKFINV